MRIPIAIVGLLLLTGCSADPSADPSPSGSAEGKTVSVHKTGGIAGVDETLTVDAKGAWTQTTRTGTTSGQLTDIQVKALQELASDPRLQTEARRSTPATNCADAFNYTVRIDSVEIQYVDCPGDADLPLATMALVAYLGQVVS